MYEDVEGLIAYRKWSYKDGFLKSTGVEATWENSIGVADTLPEVWNKNGIHAYSLNILRYGHGLEACIVGVVELRGKILEHGKEGIYRAEWCRILQLFVQEEDKTYLSALSRYAPVVCTNNILKSINKWLKAHKDLVERNKTFVGFRPEDIPLENVTFEKYRKPKPSNSPPSKDLPLGLTLQELQALHLTWRRASEARLRISQNSKTFHKMER